MLLQAYTFVRVTGGDFRSRVHDRFVELTHSETGATAAEYALLVSLIAIVIVVGAFALGNRDQRQARRRRRPASKQAAAAPCLIPRLA